MPISSAPSANLARVAAAVTSAAAQGAQLAVFPEGTQARFSADLRAAAEPLDGPFCAELAERPAGRGSRRRRVCSSPARRPGLQHHGRLRP